MIRAENIAFGYGDKPLFSAVNFTVGTGQKAGLVGPNGSGKTTLLNIISGITEPGSGHVESTGVVGFVPQEVKRDPNLEEAESVLAYLDKDHLHAEHEIKKMLAGLELDIVLAEVPKNLSGGQKTKLALARALLSDADILILDEPTNFMDSHGKRWVMDFLANCNKTVLVISHDLALIDSSIDKILALEPVTRSLDVYKGGYSDFIRLKTEKEANLKRQILAEQKHIKQMETGLSKLARYTSKKGVRARIQQQKKIERAKQVLPAIPRELKKIKITLPEPVNVGELPVKLLGISKSYEDKTVIRNFDFSLRRGERVALIGPNGSGKSTLLKIITGAVCPDGGKVLKNESLKFGYYTQEFESFDMDKKVIDTFTEDTERSDCFARAFLGRYLFTGDKVYQKVATLSGGEKTRLAIALLTGHNYNLLILDEPTTYLDVMSQRIILEALKEYKGAMLVVSHTSEFLSELEPSRAILMPEERVVYWDNDLLDRVTHT